MSATDDKPLSMAGRHAVRSTPCCELEAHRDFGRLVGEARSGKHSAAELILAERSNGAASSASP